MMELERNSIVRHAQDDDEPSVRAVVMAAYETYVERLGRPPGSMLADYREPIADERVWVAEFDRTMLGILILSEEPDALHVDNVAVHPDAQGRGVGRALLGFAEGEAARRGRRELRLSTNALFTENLAIYPRLGFVETGRVLAANGSKRVHFVKQVDAGH